mmetsp:Transcript_17760/g.24784  ORF Transcript_17760/g.24784 Transcript_17760/m.24784 type:complete len:412 (+) Transcript_17760:50-1285(+)
MIHDASPPMPRPPVVHAARCPTPRPLGIHRRLAIARGCSSSSSSLLVVDAVHGLLLELPGAAPQLLPHAHVDLVAADDRHELLELGGELERAQLVLGDEGDDLVLRLHKRRSRRLPGCDLLHHPLRHRRGDVDLAVAAGADEPLHELPRLVAHPFAVAFVPQVECLGPLAVGARLVPELDALLRVLGLEVPREQLDPLGVVDDRAYLALPPRYLELNISKCLGSVRKEASKVLLAHRQQDRTLGRAHSGGAGHVVYHNRHFSKVLSLPEPYEGLPAHAHRDLAEVYDVEPRALLALPEDDLPRLEALHAAAERQLAVGRQLDGVEEGDAVLVEGPHDALAHDRVHVQPRHPHERLEGPLVEGDQDAAGLGDDRRRPRNVGQHQGDLAEDRPLGHLRQEDLLLRARIVPDDL